MNPMLGQLNQMKMQALLGNIATIKRSVDSLKALGDPQKALEQLMQGSPQMKQAMDYVNSNGGNPKEVCHKILREHGLDPDTLDKMLI